MPPPQPRAPRKKRPPDTAFGDPAVAAVFAAHPPALRDRLLALRRLIYAAAAATPGVGALVETLKWGQPSYLTAQTGSGSTIRIDRTRADPDAAAIFFHCGTDLVARFREIYGDTLRFEGNRAIVIAADDAIDAVALSHCIAMALTYHKDRRRRA